MNAQPSAPAPGPAGAEPRAGGAGRVVVVTGGGGGLGRAVCRVFARGGARVVVVGRDPGRLAASAGQVVRDGGEAIAVVADVRRDRDVARMVDRVVGGFGRVDVLVAAAGVGGVTGVVPRPVLQTELGEWQPVLDTNLGGIFRCVRAVLPVMRAQGGGEIVPVVSARGGTAGRPYAAAYCAAKFAVAGLARALAAQAAPDGVRVQAIFPDAVDTPILAGSALGATSLPADRVAAAILALTTLPRDCAVPMPVIAPVDAPCSDTARLEALP